MSVGLPTLGAVTLPLRPELAGLEPYGAPQLDVPVLLNVNENPYPPADDVVADIAADVAAAARGPQPLPGPGLPRAAPRTSPSTCAGSPASRLAPEQIWAANGSNEVMLHLLQAFGGPGRTALSFAPTYSMYPEYARDTSTGWVQGRREEDFTLDPRHAAATIAEHAPSVVLLASPNNPTGTALPLGDDRGRARPRPHGSRAGASSSWTRRTESSAAPGRRRRWRSSPTTRTSR